MLTLAAESRKQHKKHGQQHHAKRQSLISLQQSNDP